MYKTCSDGKVKKIKVVVSENFQNVKKTKIRSVIKKLLETASKYGFLIYS